MKDDCKKHGAFGWETEEFPIPGMTYTVVKVGGEPVGGIMTTPPECQAMPPCWGVYVTVDDVDATAGQVDRLLALLGVRTVQFRLLPLGVPLPAAPLHGFWILDDLVNIELLHTEVTTRDPGDVEFYAGLFEQMWDRAAHGEAARAILLATSTGYQRAAQRRNDS